MKNPRKSKQSTPTPIFIHFAPMNIPKEALPGIFLYLIFCGLIASLGLAAIMAGYRGWGVAGIAIGLVVGATLLWNERFDRMGKKVAQAMTQTEEEKAEARRKQLSKYIQQAPRSTPKRRDL